MKSLKLISYYMVQIGLMKVKINKYIFTQSVILNLPNVLKDLLLTSANFVQLLPLCFTLSVCQSFICNATFYPVNFNLLQTLAFSKGCIGDIRYYVQHFTISVMPEVSVGWCFVLGSTSCIILFSLVRFLVVIVSHLFMLL